MPKEQIETYIGLGKEMTIVQESIPEESKSELPEMAIIDLEGVNYAVQRSIIDVLFFKPQGAIDEDSCPHPIEDRDDDGFCYICGLQVGLSGAVDATQSDDLY